MGIESADDLSDFFLTDDFGVAASYTPDGGSASTVNLLFDNPFNSVPLNTGKGTLKATRRLPSRFPQTSRVSRMVMQSSSVAPPTPS